VSPNPTFSLREYEALASISNLLYNPLSLGITSPDWRRHLLEQVLVLTGGSEASLHVPFCSAVPRCVYQARPMVVGGFSIHPEPVRLPNPGRPWVLETGPPYLPVLSAKAAIELGPERVELQVHGIPMKPDNALGLERALGALGASLERWSAALLQPGLPTPCQEPEAVVRQLPLPAWLGCDDHPVRLVNEAAGALGVSPADPMKSPLVRKISGRPPWWRVPEPAPGVTQVEHVTGQRFRVFRSPAACRSHGGCAQTLVLLTPIPSRLPSISGLRTSHGLSRREAEVARFLAQGLPTKSIARELGVSWHTARGYVEKVLRKLNVSSRGQVIHSLAQERSHHAAWW
jgi:DNA-binding CsgD family transcriptional regulator